MRILCNISDQQKASEWESAHFDFITKWEADYSSAPGFKIITYAYRTPESEQKAAVFKIELIVICPDCLGDGIQTCHNPDHGYLRIVAGAVLGANETACPCCGHDPDCKMKGPCYTCSGTGKLSFAEYESYAEEFVSSLASDEIRELCLNVIGFSHL